MPADQIRQTHWTTVLINEGACAAAVIWARPFASFAEAWTACERGDWLLWWIGQQMQQGPMHPERRPLVAVACACARLALPRVPAGEHRPLDAIVLAERWANGDDTVTREQLRAAADAAAAAYAYAAYAAYAAADAAAAAADAAAADAAVAAADAAHAGVLRQCADLVRAQYPAPPVNASHLIEAADAR